MKYDAPPPPLQEGPVHLYKFRGVNDYTRAIFLDRKLYFAHADSFNDPFDCLPKLSLDSSLGELKRYLAELHRKRFPLASRKERLAARGDLLRQSGGGRPSQMMPLYRTALHTVRNRTGVLSLSERADHMLLWAHYADAHRGIALRFRPVLGDGYFEWAFPVVYQDERPTINLVRDTWWEVHERALLTKADFWAYEHEWRIVVQKFAPGAHRFPKSSLDGIILGAKISAADEASVRAWATGYDVEWLRAEVDEDSFKLNIATAVWDSSVGSGSRTQPNP